LNFHIAALYFSEADGQKIKEKGPVPLRIDGNHVTGGILFPSLVYNFQIRRLATTTGTIVNDLALDNPGSCIKNSHKIFLSIWLSTMKWESDLDRLSLAVHRFHFGYFPKELFF
jgi:hypothetical protein